jgi:hypothetical protein
MLHPRIVTTYFPHSESMGESLPYGFLDFTMSVDRMRVSATIHNTYTETPLEDTRAALVDLENDLIAGLEATRKMLANLPCPAIAENAA